MKRLFVTYKSLTLSLLFIFLFSVTVSFASPLYNSQNTTLNPQCAPTDPDCTVAQSLLTGITGGQSLIGGTSASDTLTLSSTSNSTKGKILFGTSAYDEVNNRLGIGTTTPTSKLSVQSTDASTPALTLKAASGQSAPLFSFLDANGAIVFEARSVPENSYNTFFGVGAGQHATYGTYNSVTYGTIGTNGGNTFFGNNAGAGLFTGNENTLIGSSAGANIDAASGDPNGSGALNTFIGSTAGQYTTTGRANVFVGQKAGFTNTTGIYNVYVGKSVGVGNTVGNSNTYINAGRGNNTAGSYSVLIGNNSGENQTGNYNIAIGEAAGAVVSSDYNIAIGSGAANQLTSGLANVSIGRFAGSGNITGSGNISIGERAGLAANASNNTFLGHNAGYTTDASDNTFIGAYAGYFNTTGTANVFIGKNAGWSNTTGSNQFVVGGPFNDSRIDNIYFGKGINDGSPTAYTINGTGGLGTNIAAGNIVIAGGKATGNAAGGAILFSTSDVGSSGTTLQSLSEKMRIQSDGYVGIATTTPSYTLSVGNSTISGIVSSFQNSTGTCTINPTTTALSCSSDRNLKKDITVLDTNTLNKVLSLQPVTYHWNTESSTDSTHAGFIAQEVEAIFPDLVSTDPKTGLKSLAYTGLIPYTVKAIQDINIKVSAIPTYTDTTLYTTISTFLDGIAQRGEAVVGSVKADKVTGKKLCIDDVCVTKEQLQTILKNNATVITSAPTEQPTQEQAPAEQPAQEQIPSQQENNTPPVEETVAQ